MLVGSKEIAAFIGSKRPAFITELAKRHGDEWPGVKNSSGRWCVEEDVLRTFGIRHGYIKPQDLEELKLLEEDPKRIRALEEMVAKNKGGGGRQGFGSLGDFLDLKKFHERAAPTGDIEDELGEARELRHLFGRIVFAWNLDTLSNPSQARAFKEFAAELARQIGVIAKVEDSLVKQRMRNGQLLDEHSVNALVAGIAASVVSSFNELATDLFDLVAGEVRRISDDLDMDIPLDSDRVLKLFSKRFAAARETISEGVVEKVEESKKEQAERLGGSDE